MNRKYNFVGKRFYYYTVTKEVIGSDNKRWECLCDCGNVFYLSTSSITSSRSKSCGYSCTHLFSEKEKMMGKKFGHLVVEDFDHVGNDKRYYWKCLCDCGNTSIVAGSELKRHKTTSCGCKIKRINGLYKSRLYRIHHSIICRCYTKSADGYNRYGGRGITVCDEWKNKENGFMNFYNWSVKNGYAEDLTIDRIDNDGNYEPSNCRWATRKEQSNNTSLNHYIEFDGKKKTISQWSEELNINRNTLDNRLRKWWNVNDAFTTPVNKNYSRSKKDDENRNR